MMIAVFAGAGSSGDGVSNSEADSDIVEVKVDQDDVVGYAYVGSQFHAVGVGDTFWVRIHSCA